MKFLGDIFHGVIRRLFIDAEVKLAYVQGFGDGYEQGVDDIVSEIYGRRTA